MRVLIFEPYYAGHRLNFVKELIPGLLDLDIPVTIALSLDAPQSRQFDILLKPYADRVAIGPWIRPVPGVRGTVGLVESLRRSVQRAKAKHVFIPSADGLAQILAARHLFDRQGVGRGVALECLLLRGGFAYPQARRRRAVAARLSWCMAARTPCETLFHLDPLVVAKTRTMGYPSRRVRLMPDPADPPPAMTSAVARARLGLPAEGTMIGTAGLLDERKGVDLLIRAFAAAIPRLDSTTRLLLVGELAASMQHLLTSNDQYRRLVQTDRILTVNRFVTDEEFQMGLAAMDVVCTPYPDHIGSASIVTRAAAAGRYVLGSNWGWIGYMVPRFDLGTTIDVRDVEAFAAAIPQALAAAPSYRVSERGRQFLRFHSPENYRATWTAHLRRHIGAPQHPRLLHWSTVLNSTAGREAKIASG